jgi:hypothetical protein
MRLFRIHMVSVSTPGTWRRFSISIDERGRLYSPHFNSLQAWQEENRTKRKGIDRNDYLRMAHGM